MAFACGDEDPGACVEGTFCDGNLICIDGVCQPLPGDTESDSNADETGASGDATETTEEDTGDTGAELMGLYEGPCLTSDDCAGDLWCAYQNGRFWCTSDCAGDEDCPEAPGASAVPECQFVLDNDPQAGSHEGCVLVCENEEECLEGSQCFAANTADNWCGWLP